jgi:hypothetical protein
VLPGRRRSPATVHQNRAAADQDSAAPRPSERAQWLQSVEREVTPMLRRRLPPGVVEALERVIVALWFTAVLVLLYLTLQTQLTR